MKSIRLLFALMIAATAWPQTAPKHSPPPASSRAAAPIVRDATFQSPSLGREMKYRIILPADYETSGRRYAVLYLLHGLTGHYTDWESRTHLTDYVAGQPLIVAMPEGDDSWYTNSALNPQEKWEDYIVKDFIPHIDKTYRTIQTRFGRAIGGLSMGGYGAMKFALKDPAMFIFAASFSGALSVTSGGFRSRSGSKINEQIAAIYGPEGSQQRLQNDVYELARKVTNPEALPYLWISCGTEDMSTENSLIAANEEFAALLVKQKIRHTYSESPGAHNWKFWDESIAQVIPLLIEQYFRTAPARSPARVN